MYSIIRCFIYFAGSVFWEVHSTTTMHTHCIEQANRGKTLQWVVLNLRASFQSPVKEDRLVSDDMASNWLHKIVLSEERFFYVLYQG